MDPVIKRMDGMSWVRYSDYLQIKHELDEVRDLYVKLESERVGMAATIEAQRQTIQSFDQSTKSLSSQTGQMGNSVRDGAAD